MPICRIIRVMPTEFLALRYLHFRMVVNLCFFLHYRYIFTADPRGTLKLWRLSDPVQSVFHSSDGSAGSFNVCLVAEFVSCFDIRIMCLDASFENEVFVSHHFLLFSVFLP